MFRRLLIAALASAWLAGGGSVASAQQDARERSRAAFRRGVAQVHDGDYAAARDSFVEAYQLFPHPSILLNLGIARAHTGQWVEAEQDLSRFLADDGGAPPGEIASGRAELAQARTHLGTFRLRVAPAGARATIDARPIALIPAAFVDVRATRGTHELVAEAAGFARVVRTIAVSDDRAPDVDLSLSAEGEGRHAPGQGQRTIAWFLIGGGAVAAAVGVYAGLRARSLADDYNTPGSGSFQDPSTRAKGTTFRTSADVAWVSALALAGGGVYLMLAASGPSASLATPSAGAASKTGLVVRAGWAGIAGTF